MDYMELVKRSIANAWRYKFLWFFGFFVSIAEGFGGKLSWTDKLGDWEPVCRFDHFRYIYLDFEPVFLIMLALAAFALMILFFAMAVLSEGALIHGIFRKEKNLDTGFADCWSAGLRRFFRILGIVFLAFVSVAFVVFGGLVVLVPSFFLSKALGILMLLMAIPVFIVAVFIVVAVEGWALRYGIIKDISLLDSIQQGWLLFKNNLGKTIGVALSSFVSQLIMWAILVVCLLVIAIPLVLIGMVDLWFGLVPGISLLLIVIVLSAAFFGVFSSSVWTLGFMRLTEPTEAETA
jgi:hypothetical protein